MIANEDRDVIVRLARKYGIGRVVLFGSAARAGQEPRDIDLGVEGIEPRLFFRFYGELLMALAKPVDLVDLSRKSLFTELVEETGVPLYG